MDEGQRTAIVSAGRVSNPGCYATGAIALLRPLVEKGLVAKDWPVTINAVSGYSGGGKSLITAFEDGASPNATHDNFRLYAMGVVQKHIEEIQVYSDLAGRPLFIPSVGRFAQGMLVSIPLQLWAMPGKPTLDALHGALAEHYEGERYVNVEPLEETLAIGNASSLDPRNPEPEGLNDTNRMTLSVYGNPKHQQAVLLAKLDNLGKGASGQAVQNLNLMLGLGRDGKPALAGGSLRRQRDLDWQRRQHRPQVRHRIAEHNHPRRVDAAAPAAAPPSSAASRFPSAACSSTRKASRCAPDACGVRLANSA